MRSRRFRASISACAPAALGGIRQSSVVFFRTKRVASPSKIGAVIRVSLGNFLEMYDFMVFGYYAAAIGRAFFPTKNEYASLMLSLMTFGTGYPDAPAGRDHPRRLHRPSRPPQRTAADAGADGRRHAVDRHHAGLRNHRVSSRRCWSCWAGWCRASPRASRSAASAYIWPRSRRRAAKDSSSAGNPAASRWR